MMDDIQITNEEMLNFVTNNGNLPILDPAELHNLDGVFLNPNDYTLEMPIVHSNTMGLNLPPIKEEDDRETCTSGAVKSSPTGIMPCQDEFGGNCNFEVILDSSLHNYRQRWKYSFKMRKLFIDINKVLLLNFKCDFEKFQNNSPIFVRAVPMYSEADWLKDPVDRCLQHLSPIDKLNKDFAYLHHVIRCDNDGTSYHTDPDSKRRSVVTLLPKPEHGSDSSRLSYRFVCKTSCLGGMARRPLVVIFTLEDNFGNVLGRRILSVKICSCPKRDMDREEKDHEMQKKTVQSTKKCISHKRCHTSHSHSDNDGPSQKIIKIDPSTESETDGTNNEPYEMIIKYKTTKKKNFEKVMGAVRLAIVGTSVINNLEDTESVIKDLETMSLKYLQAK